MLQPILARSASLLPQAAIGQLGWLRSAVGAFLGIGFAALSTWLLLGAGDGALPWLVAPMGASAVLVFAVPASPLAQPWPVIGGNVLSGAIGLVAGAITGSPMLAASVAVGVAIAVMAMARCLHPPGGACALLCALGAAGPEAWNWTYLLPVIANVLALSFAGWLFNGLTGHTWPHRIAVPTAQRSEQVTRESVEATLAEWDEVLDVDAEDLLAFIQAVNRRHEGGARRGR